MKIIAITSSLIALSLISCGKRDTINHYLNEKITQGALSNSGFYKYTRDGSEGIVDSLNNLNLENGDPTISSKFTNYTMTVYSNIPPVIKKGITKGPIPVFKNKSKIEGKIITYFFRNDILEFKSIISPPTIEKVQIKLFKNKEDIKNYYNNLKIPIKEISLEKLRNHNDSIGLRAKFIINNYESCFYLSNGNEMITYYLNKKRGNEDMLVWDFYNENSSYKFIE
ncbi:hypothetical protein IUY40_18265 [Flavobacterium sp. ALJ2]|uniref:hypothetical protein n=1 Tax=Flavobacterium sp. ALJ2 TaxID=2786960 RepID=UPI00189EEA4D|nr:hypothetical protein [Flavobacterium sp. ALJ2]MBF7093480.1 hypothetical protein [Flavobacterium sp. ALJ2]